MNILSLGTDKKVLDSNSSVANRIVSYSKLVDKYFVIVPNDKYTVLSLSNKILVYSTGGCCKIIRFLKLFFIAKFLIQREKINVITSQEPYFIGFIAIVLGNLFNIGVEIQVHGWEKFNFLRKNVAKYVLRRASVIRVVSNRIKNQLILDFGIKSEKVIVIPVPVNIKQKFFYNKIQAEGKIFLTMGRLVKVKNIEIQIRALATLVNSGQKVNLWIVGDGPDRNKLEKLAIKLGVKDFIKFWGWRSDVEYFYTKASVFVLSSLSEGWPLVIMEAASYGLPIIMTDVGSAGDLIINDYNGVVVPNNVEILSSAMVNLINDKDKLLLFSDNLKKTINKFPTEEDIIKLYYINWKKILKNEIINHYTKS